VAIAEARHPLDLVLGLLSRDQNLTGRREIWSMVLEAIAKRPWLGYGYEAFWRGADGPSADISLNGWIPPSAHNGFLDLGLAFGVVGPALFALALTGPILYSIRLAQRRISPLELFPLIFLLFIVLSNLTESKNLSPNTIVWDIFVALCVIRSFAQAQFRAVRSRRWKDYQVGIVQAANYDIYQIYHEQPARETT
jgi:exopolysaccharide production protein ExoQ